MKKKMPLAQTLELSEQLELIEHALLKGYLATTHVEIANNIDATIKTLQRRKFIVVEPLLRRLQHCRREIGKRRALGPLPTLQQSVDASQQSARQALDALTLGEQTDVYNKMLGETQSLSLGEQQDAKERLDKLFEATDEGPAQK